jgi:trehalose/maltose hydrolase-like predicted phosphorylase
MAFQGAIFDVDGVLVDSPHELAWRESLPTLMETEWREVRDQTSWTPERFTPAVYQQVMSGKPRMAGARAALPEASADDVHYPGPYVAGLYNRAMTEIAGRTVGNEDRVNLPNWLPLSFRVADGPWFGIQQAGLLDHRLELDLRQGTLTRLLRWQDPDGRRTQVTQRRFVSMKDQHLAGLETTFVAENWSDQTVELAPGASHQFALERR